MNELKRVCAGLILFKDIVAGNQRPDVTDLGEVVMLLQEFEGTQIAHLAKVLTKRGIRYVFAGDFRRNSNRL